ncbi:SDR family oxidoreductase [Endozoicomonadaceae bacterium StTr2]
MINKMVGDLTGHRIVVTGSKGLLGSGIVSFLHQQGCKVIAVDLEPAPVDLDPAIEWHQLDLSDSTAIEAFAAGLQQPLHGLVNNAAVSNPYNDPVAMLDINDWNRVIAINLTAPMLLVKHLSPSMVDGSSIVNIASTRAQQSEPHSEAYAASKGGLVSLTHALAVSLGPKIRVNCISPGWISDQQGLTATDHQQHPVGRVGNVDDISHATAFLLSSCSGFVTGQNWVIAGGMTRKMIYEE